MDAPDDGFDLSFEAQSRTQSRDGVINPLDPIYLNGSQNRLVPCEQSGVKLKAQIRERIRHAGDTPCSSPWRLCLLPGIGHTCSRGSPDTAPFPNALFDALVDWV